MMFNQNEDNNLSDEQRLDVEASDFDFSSDEAARESMKEFIRNNFSNLLGDKLHLLDEPNGFRKIQEAFSEEIEDAGNEVSANINKLMSLLDKIGRS